MNKLATLALSAAVTASLLATPLASQEIIVSPVSAARFVADVQSDLDRQLQRSQPAWDRAQTGVTSVRFTAGEDGRADNIVTYRRSGSSSLDRAARRAVSRLTSLAPLPMGASEGQLIQANIVYAKSERHADRLTRQLAREEAQRIASSPEERAVLALTIGGTHGS